MCMCAANGKLIVLELLKMLRSVRSLLRQNAIIGYREHDTDPGVFDAQQRGR